MRLFLYEKLNRWAVLTEPWLFSFFLLAMPWQARHIVFQTDWYFNEWRDMFVYATDFLMLALFGLAVFLDGRQWEFHLRPADKWLIAFAGAGFLSIFYAVDARISAYNFLRLVQAALFFWYIGRYAVNKFNPAYSALALLAGGVLQAGIGIIQFLRQSDLGLRLLGEGLLRSDLNGVAVFYNFLGEKVMRAYGTFPHPNLLAAYLLVSLFALYWLFFNKDEMKMIGFRMSNSIFYFLLSTFYAVILFGFFLTFSRTTIFIWAVVLVGLAVFIYKISKENRSAINRILAATAVISILFTGLFFNDMRARLMIYRNDEAVSLRIYYNGQALESGGHALNLTGIGIGGFVSWFMIHKPGLPRYIYQPAHNIFLLAYAETGVVGLLTFLLFLSSLIFNLPARLGHNEVVAAGKFKIFNKFSITDYGILILTACFLFIGLFDHFPWTLQPGRIMFWGVLGLLAGMSTKQVASSK